MRHKPHALFVAALSMATLLAQAGTARAALPEFTDLVEQNAPAVVNISTTQEVQANPHAQGRGNPFPDLPEDSPFRDFFKRFFDEQPGQQPQERQALGSGFTISADGYIMTAAHVVKDASEIIVRFKDHTEKPAKVVGLDKRTDVALLKVDAKDLPTVKIGDSDELKVGEWVVAIGSPFGLEETATQGIVSAVRRTLPSDAYVPFIQTDVAVNPGNSGGPLFNTDGKVVGINAQIYSQTGGYMGLSFAIPIDTATRIAEQLKTQGHVTRGWLGVLIQPVSRDLAESFGLKRPRGALVARVEPDSPAAAAGLQAGDVILKYDGETVNKSASLPPKVGKSEIGKNVPLKVLRDGESKTLSVKIQALDEEHLQAAAGQPGGQPQKSALNVQVTDLSPAQREQSGIAKGGALVTGVGEGPAAKAGIRQGDVILKLNNKTVASAEALDELVGDLPRGKAVSVLIQRGDSPRFLAMTLPKKTG